MTPGDRHLKAACSQLEGALDRGPSLAEREGREKKIGIVEKKEGGRAVKRCVQGQLSLVTPLQAAVAISLSPS